ncbi:unnamed protein product [Macrosiphum euphorbiae]|uniref:FLYWCH-type domain-containing protein n=1 Tax=Macrosiphum euphorbiae TaxID=13131 RepID=A0AAV0XV47_9HEMI|nr:unnamed protein product [Macrosiphum euphorbiae]
MHLELIKSQRGRDILIYNSFIHKQEKALSIEDKIIWKCNEKKKCTGRAHTIQDVITKFTDHTHVQNRAKIKAKRTINKMKENAITTVMSTHSILANTSSQLT